MTAARQKSEQRQRNILVALRLLPAEQEQLRAAADDAGCSLSELIRSAALNASQPGCGREDCRDFRVVTGRWWDQLTDMVDLPGPRPASPAQTVSAIRQALTVSAGECDPSTDGRADEESA